MKEEILHPGLLRQLLRYEPDTGKLFWLERGPEFFKDSKQSAKWNCRAWNAKYSGKEALSCSSNGGYRQGHIFDIPVRAHRVIFALMTGAWPACDVDHIDMDKTNNKWENLRLATRSENKRNVGPNKNNTSGYKGVWRRSSSGTWHADVVVNGKKHTLGSFSSASDANDAAQDLRAKLHGRFARS